jgi:hypothetical protein
MSTAAAPADLRADISQAIASDDVVGRVDESTASTAAPDRSFFRWFSGPRRANAFAVAACLALVGGAVLYGIFGPTIDQHSENIPAVAAQQLVIESAVESSRQHGYCAGSRKAREERLTWRSPDEARQRLTELLQVEAEDIQIFDLSAVGFEFHGCGECEFPGDDPAAQISFLRPQGENLAPIMVSFFIVPNHGQYDNAMNNAMQLGEWYASDMNDRRCHHSVLRTIDDRFVYFLVCCDDQLLEPLGKLVSQQMRMGKCASTTPQ